MNRANEGCPFDAKTRASRCHECVQTSDLMPPCVEAWLWSEMGAREKTAILPLFAVRQRAA